eukprot:CAMPEP_0181095044 /NCGR_PEP_ID=MMETSP1071-20121207/10315_1 /TAXON_ID=35127 /ORGANISM="Thalassiosira sp., Strain NH16" /LENGTH=1212 /DNA_ID=CAMNT_0023177411 /DNA_START=133 /DNA_END=3771 /DNA_ORIENTATION=+
MVRPLSRGRFDRSPAIEPTDGHGMDTFRSMKKKSYTPRGELYSTPPRSPFGGHARPSPLGSGNRSTRSSGGHGRGEGEFGDYDDHRNPVSEGRSYGHSNSYGRSASAMRERFDDDEQSIGGVSSAGRARDVLSRIRGGVASAARAGIERGAYSEHKPKPSLQRLGRELGGLSVPSPRRHLELHLDGDDKMYENRNDVNTTSRYEVMGMKKELKKKEMEAQNLRREKEEMLGRGRGLGGISVPSPRRRLELHLDDDDKMYENRNDENTASRFEVMGLKEELKKKDTEAQSLRCAKDEMQMKYSRKIDEMQMGYEGATQNHRREMSEMQNKYEGEKDEMKTKFGREIYDMQMGYKETAQNHRHEMSEMQNKYKGEKEEMQMKYGREMDEMQMGYEEATQNHRHEMSDLQNKYEENMAAVRSKLVSTFKEDMQEMKTEWEEAFQRLKDESDTTQRAMEMELNEATQCRADVEGELGELKTEYLTQMEDLKRSKEEDLEKEKARSMERMEELKRSKEEDLERLRSMYEEHLDSTKKSASDVESGLKEEIHMLLEENEKVKLCYENLETEMQRARNDLEEMNSNYQKAISDSLRWEKEATSCKEELDDVCDENDKHARRNKALEDDLNDTKGELERMTSQYQRAQAEKMRFEKEFNAAAKDRDEASTGYNDLVKKLDSIQEERILESRYTEALVKQRDNMNEIIENSQQEIEELKSMNAELTIVNKTYVTLGKEFDLPDGDAATFKEELVQKERMKERLDTLGRERERYNTTVKALKVDLKALHGGNVGAETSLQEHMRLLNEKWDSNESRLKQFAKLKSELEESIHLLEENAKDREHMMKEHHSRVDSLERDLQESQTALVKIERDKIALTGKLSDYEVLDSKMKRIQDELESKCETLQDRLARTTDEHKELESRCKSLDSDNRTLQAELDKVGIKKNELEDAIEKMDDVKKGLKKNLETAYYDLEEAQRELTSIRQDHADEMLTFEKELVEMSKQKDTMDSQEEEIKALKDMSSRLQYEHAKDLEDAQKEVAGSFKAQLRLMEEKHADQDRRNNEYIEQKHKEEIEELRFKNKKLERAMEEQKVSLDQKSMVEVKRRGEFAKQKQELEILRSKERHLETHVNQLEEHISKVVADYEVKLQSSNQTIGSTSQEEKSLKKKIRELEKKLEVSSAAMKQIGKSSLLMEKENERLKHDKNELKLKLRKLVDCAEKFGPK